MKSSLDRPLPYKERPTEPEVGKGALKAAELRIPRTSEISDPVIPSDTQLERESPKIKIGDTITLEIYDDENQSEPTKSLTVLLVEKAHTGKNPGIQEVSIDSAIGRNIIGKQKSDERIPVPTPNRTYVKILDVSPAIEG